MSCRSLQEWVRGQTEAVSDVKYAVDLCNGRPTAVELQYDYSVRPGRTVERDDCGSPYLRDTLFLQWCRVTTVPDEQYVEATDGENATMVSKRNGGEMRSGAEIILNVCAEVVPWSGEARGLMSLRGRLMRDYFRG